MNLFDARARAEELWGGVYLVRYMGKNQWGVNLHSPTGPLHILDDKGNPACHSSCIEKCVENERERDALQRWTDYHTI